MPKEGENITKGLGPTILTVPSQELEMKLSFVMGFQATENASRLCS